MPSSANFNSVSYFNDLFARTGVAFQSRGTATSIGLARLSQSFDLSSRLSERIEIALPIFQAPALQSPVPTTFENKRRLDWLVTCATQFKVVGGELFETLLWEPLFTGWQTSRAADFDSIVASFYGARLWYQELILSPKLRATTPIAEILITPSQQAGSNFHLYRAFLARGYCDPQLNCEVFSRLSSRRKAALLPARFLAELTRHLGENLFVRSDVSARLSSAGFGRSYRERFLVPARGISLLSQNVANLLKPKLIDDYIFSVYEFLENGLLDVDARVLKAVKCRRSIQQRALQAIQLRALISRDQFFFARHFRKSYALCVLDIYLEMLEAALATLVYASDSKRALIEYVQADEFYSDNLRDYFAQVSVIGRLIGPKKPLEFVLGNLNFAGEPEQSLKIMNGVLGAVGGNHGALEKLDSMRNFATIDLARIQPLNGEFYDLSSHERPLALRA